MFILHSTKANQSIRNRFTSKLGILINPLNSLIYLLFIYLTTVLTSMRVSSASSGGANMMGLLRGGDFSMSDLFQGRDGGDT